MCGGIVSAANPIINCNHLQPPNSSSRSYRDRLGVLSSSRSSLTTFDNIPFANVCHYPRRGGVYVRRKSSSSSIYIKSRSPVVMVWQECKVKMDVEVPTSVAYKCYSDREAIPHWMPFISTVKILEDKPDLSRWSLKYKAFGQDIEFSWLARNMQPIPNQKIHWRSLEGLPNRGAVRFYPKGSSSCTIELTVSYEVPQLLVPVATALQPFLESLLVRGLERFAKFASRYSDSSSSQSAV